MSVTNAIRTVCQRITRRIKVVEYTRASGEVVLTVEQVDYAKGTLWEGAWVELFGANIERRYQVKKLVELYANTRRWEVTLDISPDEEFEDGVTDMALLLDYQFGHAKEIQQTLAEQARDKAWKNKIFPKLILFLDIEEGWESKISVSLNLAIVTSTNKAFKALDREIESFDKVLHPLYYFFKYELELVPGIEVEMPLRHRKTDRYFWGNQPSDEQNVFAALLDAVEVNDLEMKIDKECF